MKRSRAFVLSEQLMTIMLQAGFILVLCTSFYQLISFYTRTQQVLTARNHAERVISFMDDKIRNAGLGLWRCESPSDIRGRFNSLFVNATKPNNGYNLPVSLKWFGSGLQLNYNDWPLTSDPQDKGNVLTLLYAQRIVATENNEIISAFKAASSYEKYVNSPTPEYVRLGLKLLDSSQKNARNLAAKSLFDFKNPNPEKNIKRYAVVEGFGFPMYLAGIVNLDTENFNMNGNVTVDVYGVKSEAEAKATTIPAAGELLALNCMQMFVHGEDGKDEGRQFAFRELASDGNWENKKYNQEKGILDIYMELDKAHSVFTLWVLASGGYDASLNNPRPDSWPKEANPKGNTDAAAKTEWLNSTYCHHIVYVSRASWKLNNIPPNFVW